MGEKGWKFSFIVLSIPLFPEESPEASPEHIQE